MRRLAETRMGFSAFLLIVVAVTPQTWAQEPGRLIDNVCQPVDPPMEPRSLAPAAADAVIQLTLDPSGSGVPNLLFNLLSITVKHKSLRVGFQFADGSIGVSNPVSARIDPDGAEAPQIWGFPGVNNINRLTLEAIGTVFEVDDIVIEPAVGGRALTINFDNEDSLRALPTDFTDARFAEANRYQQDGVVVLAAVNPQDFRLGGSFQTFYYLFYPRDVSIPCVPRAPAVSPPMPVDPCAKPRSEAEAGCPPPKSLFFGCKVLSLDTTGPKLEISHRCEFDCTSLQLIRESELNCLARREEFVGFMCDPQEGVTAQGECRPRNEF